MSIMVAAVEELEAEQRELEGLLRRLTPEQWRAPTKATPWDVRDQVTHLADFDEVAYDVSTGGPRQINEEAVAAGFDVYTDVIRQKGLSKSPEEMLAWYAGNAEKLRAMFREKDPKERVPWGLGMSARTLVTARLMEHWAHGLDIREALGEDVVPTPRLRSVAWLIIGALPYAFSVAKVETPPGSLRVELAYDCDVWTFGPEDAASKITGDALEFCKVGVQRLGRAEAQTLHASGPYADAALTHARAFL